ncbi:MAG: hypothetical protein RIQ89_1684 [Bacteroidota bacterium]|jgi:hypothetical protein
MNPLVQSLQQEAGLTEEQAAKAVTLIGNALKSKFPTVLHDELDEVLKGNNFGDAFKDKIKDFTDKAEDAAGAFANKTNELVNEMSLKMKEMFNNKK